MNAKLLAQRLRTYVFVASDLNYIDHSSFLRNCACLIVYRRNCELCDTFVSRKLPLTIFTHICIVDFFTGCQAWCEAPDSPQSGEAGRRLALSWQPKTPISPIITIRYVNPGRFRRAIFYYYVKKEYIRSENTYAFFFFYIF